MIHEHHFVDVTKLVIVSLAPPIRSITLPFPSIIPYTYGILSIMATLIPNTSFSVKFDLTGGPKLTITDTTTSAPSGFVAIVSITSPDGFTRVGNIATPDISAAGGSYSYTLNLDSTANVQIGDYIVTMTALAPGYLSTNFTRNFTYNYSPVAIKFSEDFDVFTPRLKYIDATNYSVSNYGFNLVNRSWSASSIPTGTITGTSAILDLIHSGHYWDAVYNITLTSSLTYNHNVYTWLTIDEVISGSAITYAQTPATLLAIIDLMTALKAQVDSYQDTVQAYFDAKQNFEWCQSLFGHIIDRIKVGSTTNIFTDLISLLEGLHNYHIPAYTATNAIIYPYNLTTYLPGAFWGNVTGTITNQTDLVNYVATQIAAGSYAADIGNGSATTFNITHGLNTKDVVVEISKNATGATVLTDVVRTSTAIVSVTFKIAPTNNQYRVIIKK